jgi:UDP-glucose 4-epimerase
MAVLVIGGAGYIGGHTTLELVDAGEEVVVVDDLSTGFEWAIPPNVRLIIGDYGDEELIGNLIKKHGIDEIIHFAAKIIVPESVIDPLGYYLNNTAKTRSLLSSAVNGGVSKIIFSSTAAVYGDPVTNPVIETDQAIPVSPYGRSKLMVEWMLDDIRVSNNVSYVILRYFNVAGADPIGRYGQSSKKATHLIKMAVRTALGIDAKLKIYGTDYPTPDGTCIRDYIQVNDLARAHISALEYLRDGGDSQICNCGYEKGVSVLSIIESVKRNSGINFMVEETVRRAGDPAAIIASNRKLKRLMGWTPKYDDLDVIVQQAINWEKKLINMTNKHQEHVKSLIL